MKLRVFVVVLALGGCGGEKQNTQSQVVPLAETSGEGASSQENSTAAGETSTGAQAACVEDTDCAQDELCDRGLACVSRFGTAAAPSVRGNNCGDGGVPADLNNDPCGASYVCYEGLCRSCLTDDECRDGYSCIPTEGYGNQCGIPRSGAPAPAPTDVPENP